MVFQPFRRPAQGLPRLWSHCLTQGPDWGGGRNCARVGLLLERERERATQGGV